MLSNLPLFPVSASTISGEIDMLYFFLLAVSVFFAVLIAAAVVIFSVRFKQRHPGEVGAEIHGSLVLELTWTLIPLALTLVMFVWGAKIFFFVSRPPADAMDMTVVGKQWMWKVQHPEGVREINEMHVPIGRPVRLTIGSEDVIHDYSIPAFRVKIDAVPGKLTTMWFTATQTGSFHIFCSQYCGTKHAGMVGTVVVMTQPDYEAWLAGGRTSATTVQSGEKLFADLACITCHKHDSSGRGPSLLGVFGNAVKLADGRTIVADENYLRESIVNSQAKRVAGFEPIMPVFQGMVSEENLLQLIAYIKTLKAEPAGPAAPEAIK
jgi:cytochrome c oxidase subunit 2